MADVPAVQVLLTITGVGLISAAATWAILEEPHRFPRAKQVARYAGFDPSIVQSGEQHRQGRISKAGSPLLRTLLVEAAHSLARWDSGPLGQFYARKAQEIGPRKAIIALARKLLIVAWRMLQTGEIYRSGKNDDGNPQAPRVANEEPDSDGVNAVSSGSDLHHSTAKSTRQRAGGVEESMANARFVLTSITGGNLGNG